MGSIRFDVPLILMMICTIVSTEKCTNPLPALMQMASGVDITSLDLFTDLGDYNGNHGLLENVFNFTCSGVNISERLYKKDNDFNEYDLPDQITDISLVPKSDYYGEFVNFISSWGNVKARLLTPFVPKDYIFPQDDLGVLSRNAKYTSMLKQHFDSNKVFYEVAKTRSSELVAEIQVSAWSNGTLKSILSHDFLEFITHKLPPKYEDNVTAYETFIARFGTHYLGEVHISDYDYVQFALDQGYLLDTSDWQIKNDMKKAFDDYFNDSSINFKNIPSDMILAYSTIMYGLSRWFDNFTGAEYRLLRGYGKSIRQALVYPIEKLIDNETIRTQVGIAVRMHRIRAQLEEFVNICNFTSDYYQLSSEAKVALQNVTKLVESSDIKQIDQMITSIGGLYDKVRRFRDKHFLTPAIDDLYVIASTKLEFAKQICPFSARKCPASRIWKGANETSMFYEAYHNSAPNYDDDSGDGYLRALGQTRGLNQEYDLRADISNGLRARCTEC